MKNRLITYKNFHHKAKIQKQIIDRHNFTYHLVIDVIDKYIGSNMSILDIGCGVGTLALYAANKGNKVVGIDISKNAILTSKINAKKSNILSRTSFYVKDFPRENVRQKFDLILCIEVIEHLLDDNAALRAVKSMLKKGGILILSTPSSNALLYRLGYAKGFDERVGHLRRYTLENLVEKCKLEGFKVLETKKTEGVFRNLLFLNPLLGLTIRLIRYPASVVVNMIDKLSLYVFGESQIFVIAQKP